MSDAITGNGILPFRSRGGLTFGIYHGGVVEFNHQLATGKPDCADNVNRALDRLQGGKHLMVRSYLRFGGTDSDLCLANMPGLTDLAQYTWSGRRLDLVLSNSDPTGNLTRWVLFIERIIQRYGEYLGCLQICDEPNQYEFPGDGRFGHAIQSIVSGVRAARASLRKRGLACAVGFNSVPSSLEHDPFWEHMSRHVNAQFLNALDYIGINFYPDVAEPVPGAIEDEVESILIRFRKNNLAKATIPNSIPLHICEHGWPTGPHRLYTRQAEILERVIKKVYELSSPLNITHFGLFSLRDADTANPDLGHQFGILRDDYSPKPAFETYRRLIQSYGL